MLLFVSYLDDSIQALLWTIKSRTYSTIIKLVRICVVLKFMWLSLLCMVGSFVVKICASWSHCKIKTWTKITKI